MKSSTFKRCLNLSLAVSIGLSAAAPLSVAHAQSFSGTDPIALLVEAMKSDSPARAKELLDRAKVQLQKEQLPEDSMRKVEALFSSAEQAIEKRGPQKPKMQTYSATQSQQPIGFTFDDKGQVVANKPLAASATAQASTPQTATSNPTPTPTPTPAPTSSASAETDELQKLLLENPALRDSMREIGKARVTRDASNLQATMPTQIAEQTKKDVALATLQSTPDSWIQSLFTIGLIKDPAAENAPLRDQYEGVPTEFLADLIIKDAAMWSGGAGGVRYVMSKIKDSPFLAKAGIGAEAAATFIINANMVLRLIDIYGLKLSQGNQQVALMGVFAIFKGTTLIGVKTKAFQETVGKTGSLFAKALATNSSEAMKKYLGVVLNNPFMLKLLRKSPMAMTPMAAVVAPIAPAAPQAAGAPAVTPAAGVEAVLPVKKMTPGAIAWEGVSLLLNAGFSAVETYSIGQTAKIFIKRALITQREASNESIRQLLLSKKGDGFLKLLILSMNVGNHIPSFTNPQKANDAKVRFILNLARATKRCSPGDKVAYEKAVAKQRATIVTKAKAATINSPLEERILRYACETKLNQDDYEQLMQEFSTLNSIPQSLVNSLRLEKYGRRVRLGEIVYQMMFLDGGIDNEEHAFFNDTVAKILGLEILEGMRYFDKFHAFIVDHNGMVKSAASPTGYAIGADVSENPYDLSTGFTISGGPQLTTQQAQTQ